MMIEQGSIMNSNQGSLGGTKDADVGNVFDANKLNQNSFVQGVEPSSESKVLQKTPDVDPQALMYIPEEIAHENNVAIFAVHNGVAQVAILDVTDIKALNIIRFVQEQIEAVTDIQKYIVSERVFAEILQHYKTAENAVSEVVDSFDDTKQARAQRRKETGKLLTRENIADAPVAKLMNVIVDHAINGRASDIHIEPYSKEYRVRFRVDGILHSSLTFPMDVGRAIVSHIKILSNLKIDEKRKPQDGRFNIELDNDEQVDFRVSSLPVVGGEKVVIRILKKNKENFDLNDLGVVGRNYEILMERIRETFGMILITGPTGSGKSTTLYSFLNILNEEQRNIITLEDPVEYYIEGINQSQVRPEVGYTFANGLRSILRQDPNVLMIGEIRDGETAELSIHASLTGHLVFSTLHTNSAVGAISRLIDMGLEPFLLAAALREVIAQRLVRRICDKCKEQIALTPAIIAKLREELETIAPEEIIKYNVDLTQGLQFYHGAGCDECGDTGYKGRMAIYEVIGINDEIQAMITENNTGDELTAVALRNGMITMRQDGILKALLGITTLEEVERMTDGSASMGNDS